MCFSMKIYEVIVLLLFMIFCQECNNKLPKIDKQYHLVTESYNVAKKLFHQGRTNYDSLKTKSLEAIDLFLDLVEVVNNAMAREVRSAVIKFYKIQYFYDFTNYATSMDEMRDIVEHCLIEPVEKEREIRAHFHEIIRNFEDVRNFDQVEKCREELPDEVAATHCILHQAVLLNELMKESLTTIVEIKTRQHAQEMNASLYNVQQCFKDFVPKFFDTLLLDAYTSRCKFLKVVNASTTDLMNDKKKKKKIPYATKWRSLVKILKEQLSPNEPYSLPPNLISEELIKSII